MPSEPMTLIERLRNPQWEVLPGNARHLHIEQTLADMEEAAGALATAIRKRDADSVIISKGVYDRLRDLVISFAQDKERGKGPMAEIDRENEQFNQGVLYTVDLLAKAIGAPDTWFAGDGSEDYDDDLSQTLINILAARGLYDPETGEFAAPAPKTEIAMVREIEVEWLAAELAASIANLGYPVGMGLAPHPEQVKKAAEKLFDRYAKMIDMARRAPRLEA